MLVDPQYVTILAPKILIWFLDYLENLYTPWLSRLEF
jgi:hypothetical protein